MEFADVIFQKVDFDNQHYIVSKRILGGFEPENKILAAICMDSNQLQHILELIDFYEKNSIVSDEMQVKNFYLKQALKPLQEILPDLIFNPV